MIVLGRLTAPYGIQGWLHLHAFGDEPARWAEIGEWWLGRDEEDFSAWRAFPLQSMRPQGKGWVVKFAGIDDRNAAEGWAGSFVGAPRTALPAARQNEYYWADLIGLTVVNEQQETLGRVSELIEAGAHAVLVVKAGEGGQAMERLLPFVGAVVKEVDVAGGKLHVAWHADW